MSILLYGCTTWTLTKRIEKKLDSNYTKIAASNIEQVMEIKQLLYGQIDEPDMRDTAGEVRTTS